MTGHRLVHGVSMALAVLCFAKILDASSLIREGFIQYSPAPTEARRGAEADISGTQGARAVPLSRSTLFDGSGDDGASLAWHGSATAGRNVCFVIDLLRDRPVDSIELRARFNDPHSRIQQVTVAYRADQDQQFHVAGQMAWDGPTQPRINLGQTARYIRVTLRRQHSFINIPLDEMRITSTDDASAPVEPRPVPDLSPEFTRDVVLVDRYGQYLYEGWPNKVQSDEQLRAEAVDEMRRLGKLTLNSTEQDQYGGASKLAAQKASGFFRLQKLDGRWWFITPDGHPFFLIGVDACSWRESGYSSPLRYKDGRPYNAFTELPDRKVFPKAYIGAQGGGESISFLIANLTRKYGRDFESSWSGITESRLRSWGFNANAKWSRDEAVHLPYITVLRAAGDARRIKWAADPFDPHFADAVERGVSGVLDRMKSDPWIIGHTFENEKGWDREVVDAALGRGADCAAKQAFIQCILDRHGGDIAAVAQYLGSRHATQTELLAKPLKLGPDCDADVSAFLQLASQRYFSTVRAILKKYDPNHLFLGASLTPGWHSSYEFDVGAIDSVDAVSLDFYGSDPDRLQSYFTHDKPVILLEFSFSANDRGLWAHSKDTAAPDQRGRGLYYRYLVENLASNPNFTGFGWFLYYDQPVAARSLPEGENFNMGLVNQADQPYVDMLEEMTRTNNRLYGVHGGNTPPIGKNILPISAQSAVSIGSH